MKPRADIASIVVFITDATDRSSARTARLGRCSRANAGPGAVRSAPARRPVRSARLLIASSSCKRGPLCSACPLSPGFSPQHPATLVLTPLATSASRTAAR
jgi:hypothetical protein